MAGWVFNWYIPADLSSYLNSITIICKIIACYTTTDFESKYTFNLLFKQGNLRDFMGYLYSFVALRTRNRPGGQNERYPNIQKTQIRVHDNTGWKLL